MSRLRLESFSQEELQAEAIRYGLTPNATRPRLIDQIMSHLEQHGPLLDMRYEQSAVDSVVLPDRNTTHDGGAQILNTSPGLPSVSTAGDQFQVLLEEMKLQRELFQQMLKAMQSNQQIPVANPVVSFSGSERATVTSIPERFPSASPVADANSSTRSGASILSTVPAAQAITLLSSQIPTFGGTPDENVDLWLRKIERVSRIHNVSEDVTLLAASSKLTKLARDWFDLDTGTINDSWSTFKIAITERFHLQIPFHIIIQKVEARKWNFAKETFQEYALHKLRLMQNLNLSDSDQLNFLITGIGSTSIRASAAALDVKSISQFLQKMHKITMVCSDQVKQQSSFNKQEKNKVKTTNDSSSRGDDSPLPRLLRIYTVYIVKPEDTYERTALNSREKSRARQLHLRYRQQR